MAARGGQFSHPLGLEVMLLVAICNYTNLEHQIFRITIIQNDILVIVWKQNVFFAWMLIQLALFCLLGHKKFMLLDELLEPFYYNILYPLSISTANSIVILANFYLIISIEFLDFMKSQVLLKRRH